MNILPFTAFNKRIYRKKKIDESQLYDKFCPQCGSPAMILLWSWAKTKYTKSRCARVDCNYGNTKDDEEED